ncbi:MAG: amidase family protein [Bacilli bacterium]|nr:amidase family protein [Bacilli bacterium]MDD4407058.1 amidase family protein [Bacilli bacterium]
MIRKLHNKIKNNEIISDDLVKEAITNAEKSQKELNAFVTIIKDAKRIKSDNLLSGIPVAIKDNFSTKDILSTGSSNTLKDYIPYFDATAIKKLQESGAVIIGKTAMDELGMGGTGLIAATGPVKNPWNINKITGGSSSGSAAAVAAGIVPYALGTDTGDSIRIPAAHCGIVGYKPTYGLVSRFGVFAFASSLDTVGVLSTSVEDAAIVIDQIKGKDEYDMTSWNSENINLLNSLDGNVKNKKLFYIKEICDINNYEEKNDEVIKTLKEFNKTIKKCKELGIEIEEESFDQKLLDSIYPTYLTIASAEATSNMSNLTGIIFGPRGKGNTIDEMMKDHRTKGFSSLIKRRFVIGSYVLQKENQEKYLFASAKVRHLIVNKMNELFIKYDGLILPASSEPAPNINGIRSSHLRTEQYLAIANFGGYPSITIPSGFVNDMPIGVNITGKIKDDANILNIAYTIEEKLGYKNQTTKGWK